MQNTNQIVTGYNIEIVRENKRHREKEMQLEIRRNLPTGQKMFNFKHNLSGYSEKNDNNKQETNTGPTNYTFKAKCTAHISIVKNNNRTLETNWQRNVTTRNKFC